MCHHRNPLLDLSLFHFPPLLLENSKKVSPISSSGPLVLSPFSIVPQRFFLRLVQAVCIVTGHLATKVNHLATNEIATSHCFELWFSHERKFLNPSLIFIFQRHDQCSWNFSTSFLISKMPKFTFTEPIYVLLLFALQHHKDRQSRSTDLYLSRLWIRISLRKKYKC